MGEWTDRQIPAGGVDLIGFSMGGWIAARMALQRPQRVRRLVLASSVGVRLDPPPPRRLLVPATLQDVRDLVDILTVRPLRFPSFLLRDLLRRARPERGWLVDSALRGEGLLDDDLGRIRQPTLVLWGREDRLIPPEIGRRLAAGISGARAVEIAGCGHLPYLERRAEFRRAVEGFLA
jgi:pimeloyl-ACP methyl ester carboxylesterase